jgi:hypothetical protein
MRIALGFVLMVLFVALPMSAQSIGGSLAPATHFQTLPWTPPASPQALEVTGSDTTFEPSRFLSFDRAVAEGNVALQQQAKTVVQAAAECRRAAGEQAATRIDQANNGDPVVSPK